MEKIQPPDLQWDLMKIPGAHSEQSAPCSNLRNEFQTITPLETIPSFHIFKNVLKCVLTDPCNCFN